MMPRTAMKEAPSGRQDTSRPVMRMPDEERVPEPAAPVLNNPVRTPRQGYYSMDDAPLDGKAVLLTDGFIEVRGRYRHTRFWDKKGGLWREKGVWSKLIADGGGPIGFEPTGYRAIPGNYGYET